jgi:hypothetical protein
MTILNHMVFKIGGIGIGIYFKPGMQFTTMGLFPEFLIHEPPSVEFQVSPGPDSGQLAGSLLFDSSQAWRLFSDGDRRILWVGTRDFIPRLVGIFNDDYESGEIFVSQSTQDEGKYYFPLGYPLGEILMILLLGTGYGLMLHSCAVVDGESGMLFAGKSSAGKTTTARLWNDNTGVRVLNDDHAILRKVDGQYRVYGTPWHGQGGFALAEDAPLKKLFILKQAPSNLAVRLSPAQAAAALLVRSFAPMWDATAMAFTMKFLDELCQAVPCYELGFLPNQSAVDYVRCLSSD